MSSIRTRTAPPHATAPRVAIVGAGIGGLSAAHTLLRHAPRLDLHVFERSARAGGAICSIHEQGFIVELGPNTLLDRGGVISTLIDELDLHAERVYPSSTSNKRYVVRDELPHALPMSLKELWTTPLFSTQAKLRLLREPLVSPREDADEIDESLHNFVARRLGEELVDYALDPFIAGTYAGVPAQLSSRHALKRLKELEDQGGSLFGGALRGMSERREKKRRGEPAPPKSAMINFRGGAQTLTDAMAAELGDRLHLNASITTIEQREGGRWVLRSAESGEELAPFDAVLLALPAPAIAKLTIRRVDASLLDSAAFTRIEHPPVTMMAFGFERAQIAHPLDGFGMLIPSKEPFTHLGSLWSSTVFTDRAPRGQALVMVFFGGARHPESALWSQEERERVVKDELGRLIGLTGEPTMVMSRTWEEAIPQYEVGYERLLSPLLKMESDHPGLYMIGTWRDGIAVPDVVSQGRRAAHSIARYVHL